MNICKSIVVCISLALIVAACKSPTNKTVDDFNKTDSLLENTDAKVVDSDSLTLLSLSILAMQKQNPQLAIQADSIYLSTTNATAFIDSVKNVLSNKDASGQDAQAATQLMNSNNTGDQLYHYLLSAYNYASKAATKNNNNNNTFAYVTALPSSNTFIQKYFNNTPTVSAITILTKLKGDCVTTAIAALNDIKGQLKYK